MPMWAVRENGGRGAGADRDEDEDRVGGALHASARR